MSDKTWTVECNIDVTIGKKSELGSWLIDLKEYFVLHNLPVCRDTFPWFCSLLHLIQETYIGNQALSWAESCVEQGLECLRMLIRREQQQEDQFPWSLSHHTRKSCEHFAWCNIVAYAHCLPPRWFFCHFVFESGRAERRSRFRDRKRE